MKYQGMYRVGCQCPMCVGPNGGGKPQRKKIKHGGRQDDRKLEKDGLQSFTLRRTKETR